MHCVYTLYWLVDFALFGAGYALAMPTAFLLRSVSSHGIFCEQQISKRKAVVELCAVPRTSVRWKNAAGERSSLTNPSTICARAMQKEV